MKRVILVLVFLACATSAEAADAWTCTYPFLDDRIQMDDAFFRFEIAPPDLIETEAQKGLIVTTPAGTHYRILQNNDYGLVATFSISGIVEGEKDPYVGAASVVINKTTGQFYWAEAMITRDETKVMNLTHRGRCLHD